MNSYQSHRVNLEPAFILHTRPFRDTSLLINAFSRNHGHLMLVARGARSQKSPLRAILSPFTPLLISWAGKTDLPTLCKAEVTNYQQQISGKAALNGLYLNELLLRLLDRHNPYTRLFDVYQQTVAALQNADSLAITLRLFEKNLLQELGYGLELAKEVDGTTVLPHADYNFDFGVGLRKSAPNEIRFKFKGQSLLALHNEQFATASELAEAERLLQTALQMLLGGKQLKSREFC